MRHFRASCCLVLGSAFLTGMVRAQASEPDHALLLQKNTRKIIAAAEPGIACVLVSRSDAYRRAGQPPVADWSGKLGIFDPGALDLFGKDKDERDLLRRKLDMADPAYVPESFGSGVAVDPKGLILTNYHVVRDATKIFVRLPGGKAGYADVHAADPRSDLAILRLLNLKALPVSALALGDGGKIERGQFVVSLANPYAAGFRDGQPSASLGIVSNLRRRIPGQLREDERTKPLYYYGTLLQTDVRLHLGCSGGALLDLDGQLIGLTSAFAAIHGSDAPGGYALPLDLGMHRIIEVLKRGEEVEYGFLGIVFKERGLEKTPGVAIDNVTPGSPADLDARLHPHDILLAVNGQAINESDDLFLRLGTQLAGSKVELRVLRHDSKTPVNVQVTLAKFYVTGKKIASSLGNRPYYRGLRVDYSSLLAQQPPRLGRVPPGVLVSEVQPASAAARAKLRPGEVITHVNKRQVTTPAQFYQAVAELTGPVELSLYNFAPQEPATTVVLN